MVNKTTNSKVIFKPGQHVLTCRAFGTTEGADFSLPCLWRGSYNRQTQRLPAGCGIQRNRSDEQEIPVHLAHLKVKHTRRSLSLPDLEQLE